MWNYGVDGGVTTMAEHPSAWSVDCRGRAAATSDTNLWRFLVAFVLPAASSLSFMNYYTNCS